MPFTASPALPAVLATEAPKSFKVAQPFSVSASKVAATILERALIFIFMFPE